MDIIRLSGTFHRPCIKVSEDCSLLTDENIIECEQRMFDSQNNVYKVYYHTLEDLYFAVAINGVQDDDCES